MKSSGAKKHKYIKQLITIGVTKFLLIFLNIVLQMCSFLFTLEGYIIDKIIKTTG